ncbi:MAG: NB-ARC domain-containing protein, partial [Pseudonocardiaceae bacterium]
MHESGGAVADFARDLRRLRARAGSPPYRSMARSAWFSPSVLSSAASGHRLPTLRVTLAFVAACDGDRHYWEQRWRRLSARFGSPADGGTHVDEARERNGRRAADGTTPMFPSQLPPAQLPPAQLPMRPRGVSGRATEHARLRAEQALRTTPLVISGPVGVGKTDFALRYAHDMAAGMPDGQLYADLGATEPHDDPADVVLPAFLRALGITDQHLPDLRWQQEGLYRSLVAHRRLIVLLDNVRDEAQVRPFLAETSRSLLIVVSRRPLLGLNDVHRLDLDVLPRHESIAMLGSLIGERAEPQVYGRLAELCGDLPLALDVAGRKLAARPGQELSDVVDHLARHGDLL